MRLVRVGAERTGGVDVRALVELRPPVLGVALRTVVLRGDVLGVVLRGLVLRGEVLRGEVARGEVARGDVDGVRELRYRSALLRVDTPDVRRIVVRFELLLFGAARLLPVP